MSLNRKLEQYNYVGGVCFRRHCERFAVSACGKVLGRSGRILKPKSQGQYLTVSYVSPVGVRHKYVHRLVAEVWCIKPPGAEYVNHIDGNKRNNSIDNLEWCTAKENTQHAINTGLHWNCPKPGECGFRGATKVSSQHDAKLGGTAS